jgi:hypothetical protein
VLDRSNRPVRGKLDFKKHNKVERFWDSDDSKTVGTQVKIPSIQRCRTWFGRACLPLWLTNLFSVTSMTRRLLMTDCLSILSCVVRKERVLHFWAGTNPSSPTNNCSNRGRGGAWKLNREPGAVRMRTPTTLVSARVGGCARRDGKCCRGSASLRSVGVSVPPQNLSLILLASSHFPYGRPPSKVACTGSCLRTRKLRIR